MADSASPASRVRSRPPGVPFHSSCTFCTVSVPSTRCCPCAAARGVDAVFQQALRARGVRHAVPRVPHRCDSWRLLMRGVGKAAAARASVRVRHVRVLLLAALRAREKGTVFLSRTLPAPPLWLRFCAVCFGCHRLRWRLRVSVALTELTVMVSCSLTASAESAVVAVLA